MRKPQDTKIRTFVARVVELNGYLALFTPFAAHQTLPNDEILNILEFAIPNRWRNQAILNVNARTKYFRDDNAPRRLQHHLLLAEPTLNASLLEQIDQDVTRASLHAAKAKMPSTTTLTVESNPA